MSSIAPAQIITASHTSQGVNAALGGGADHLCRFDTHSQYLGDPPSQAFIDRLQKEHCQSCKNILLSKLFRRKNSFSDANLFFLLLTSCENPAPPPFFWLLTPASPSAEAAHTACQQGEESKQGLGGPSSVCEERVSSTPQSSSHELWMMPETSIHSSCPSLGAWEHN